MTGFKNFLLRGNLVEIATGLIIALAFATVVSTFTAWLFSLIPGLDDLFDGSTLSGAFLNSVVTFIVVAAVVYFAVIMPYTKAKEKYFPDEEPGDPADVALLTEIRDLLAQGRSTTGAGPSV